MQSIRQLFKIGLGPSSSHTMGPRRAAERFVESLKDRTVTGFEVTLYGSLAATGEGHMTDVAILDVLDKIAPTKIVWEPDTFLPVHPNALTFRALDGNGEEIAKETYYSVGGGDIVGSMSKCLRVPKFGIFSLKFGPR